MKSVVERPRILLVGSSGGGCGHVGTGDELIDAVRRQLTRRGMDLVGIQFVKCAVGLDTASSLNTATVVVDTGGGVTLSPASVLPVANRIAAATDVTFGKAVAARRVDGIIVVSCAPHGVNREVLRAAAEVGVPVVGTGGASIAQLCVLGCRVLPSSGGSVATAPEAKAIVFSSALAGALRPRHVEAGLGLSEVIGAMAAPHSILASALPIFLTLAVVQQCLDLQWVQNISILPVDGVERLSAHDSGITALALGAVAATVWGKCAPLDVLAGTAAVAAGVSNGSIIAALAAVAVSTLLVQLVLARVAHAGLPSTPASIIVCSIAMVVATLVASMMQGPGLALTAAIRSGITDYILGWESPLVRALFGALAGVLTFVGACRGLYHRVVLPLVIIEMEVRPGALAFFGALDLCCLCMTSAGVCLAAWITPGSSFSAGNRRLGKFGALQTLCVGDFIESAEPFLVDRPSVWWVSTASSALAGAILANGQCRSTAYLPLPLAVALSECGGMSHDREDDWGRAPLVVAVAVCISFPFLATAFGTPTQPPDRTS
eukprot:m.219257 g.219257  ORF g.219257 m.219257 type:complete len:548 (-) comp25747_c0_seq1:426-2069(-)